MMPRNSNTRPDSESKGHTFSLRCRRARVGLVVDPPSRTVVTRSRTTDFYRRHPEATTYKSKARPPIRLSRPKRLVPSGQGFVSIPPHPFDRAAAAANSRNRTPPSHVCLGGVLLIKPCFVWRCQPPGAYRPEPMVPPIPAPARAPRSPSIAPPIALPARAPWRVPWSWYWVPWSWYCCPPIRPRSS